MKKVAIVTLTYNKLEEATMLFLDSLYKYTNTELFDLVIVDNASTDGTSDYLKEFSTQNSNITLIFNDQNLGYSKGNNIGIKKALEGEYEYIALLNNDILFTPNWLEDTISVFSESKRLGMISPRIQKSKKITSNNYLNKYQNFLKKFKGKYSYSIEPLFCCVFIKKDLIKNIGLMDEAYTPAFWEDCDYCFRAMYKGYSLARSNISFVFHNHSTTSKLVPSEIFERNKEYFFKKHPLGKWVWEHKRTNVIKDIKNYIKEKYE